MYGYIAVSGLRLLMCDLKSRTSCIRRVIGSFGICSEVLWCQTEDGGLYHLRSSKRGKDVHFFIVMTIV